MQNYFWNLFEHTGNIEAYLAYKEFRNSLAENKGDKYGTDKGQRDSY